MEKQRENDINSEAYPELTISCDDCSWQVNGQIGPINNEDPYPLVKYIYPNLVLSDLLNHHYTNRNKHNFGHNSFFAVYNGQNVGNLKVSSSIQQFILIKNTTSK